MRDPDVGADPTTEIAAPLPPPDPAAVQPSPQPDTEELTVVPGADEPSDQPDTGEIPIVPAAVPDRTEVEPEPEAEAEPDPTEPEPEPVADVATDQQGVVTAETPPVAAASAPITETVPIATLQPTGVFDGDPEEFHHTTGRHPFRVGLLLVLAAFGALAAVMVPASDIIDIRTTRPIDGISTGIVTLDDIGTNLAVAGYIGAGALIVGAVLGSFGFRWGAGIAGGAGLALIGWAGIVLGLGEVPISRAEMLTRTSTQQFTLTTTRDVGYWLVVGVAGLGLLVFLSSLRSSGRGGRGGLDPWIAALGALASLGVAIGPLIPVNDASFSDNFQSTVASGDLPTLYFVGRLTQLALIAFAGVVGFLLVRAYGLGLAAGGISVATWMWITSAAEIGSKPIGVGIGNFGSRDTAPHAVTSVAIVATIVMLLVAATLATVRFSRERTV